MGWGGARSGAGAKPKKQGHQSFTIHDGGRDGVVEPPETLRAELAVYWRRYAPLASRRGTLTASTVPNFELLCEVHEQKDLILKKIREGDLGGLRLLSVYTKQLQSLHKDYALGAFGKPSEAKPKATANPFAAFGGGVK